MEQQTHRDNGDQLKLHGTGMELRDRREAGDMAGSQDQDGQLEKFHVPAEKLESVWPLVEPDLHATLVLGRHGWSVEDVGAEILEGRAYLTIAFDGDEYAGFAVSNIRFTPMGPVVHIWLLGGKNLLAETEWFLDEARKIGAVAVEFTSPRKGFQRLKHFEPVATVYRAELW